VDGQYDKKNSILFILSINLVTLKIDETLSKIEKNYELVKQHKMTVLISKKVWNL
jgi:hypothetical protein